MIREETLVVFRLSDRRRCLQSWFGVAETAVQVRDSRRRSSFIISGRMESISRHCPERPVVAYSQSQSIFVRSYSRYIRYTTRVTH